MVLYCSTFFWDWKYTIEIIVLSTEVLETLKLLDLDQLTYLEDKQIIWLFNLGDTSY